MVCYVRGLEELAACILDSALELEELVAELGCVGGVDYLERLQNGLELFKLGMVGNQGLDTLVYEDETVGNL